MSTEFHKLPLNKRIYEIVRQIPYGYVATYGQISRLVSGSTPRLVGFAMASAGKEDYVPWHRVINAKGKISARSSGGGSEIQRLMLEEEGILFTAYGVIELDRYGWL